MIAAWSGLVFDRCFWPIIQPLTTDAAPRLPAALLQPHTLTLTDASYDSVAYRSTLANCRLQVSITCTEGDLSCEHIPDEDCVRARQAPVFGL